ncbi:hypothetical protein V7S43_012890 [Phytophthora oleae]|uniref:Uncharacterized protein n=1 Tax=Phytophthora oleae TaxID=2107226 RepID=A0ABD3F5F8_9STRA
MELRSRASKDAPVYREMGRDHSSDDDFVDDGEAAEQEPARKKARTGTRHKEKKTAATSAKKTGGAKRTKDGEQKDSVMKDNAQKDVAKDSEQKDSMMKEQVGGGSTSEKVTSAPQSNVVEQTGSMNEAAERKKGGDIKEKVDGSTTSNVTGNSQPTQPNDLLKDAAAPTLVTTVSPTSESARFEREAHATTPGKPAQTFPQTAQKVPALKPSPVLSTQVAAVDKAPAQKTVDTQKEVASGK